MDKLIELLELTSLMCVIFMPALAIVGYTALVGGREKLLELHPYLKQKKYRVLVAVFVVALWFPMICIYSSIIV